MPKTDPLYESKAGVRMLCLWCQRTLTTNLTVKMIFSYRPIYWPRLCLDCLEKFEVIQLKNHCPVCQKKQTGRMICADCRYWQGCYPKEDGYHQALFHYNSEMQTFFQQFKGSGDYRLRTLFQAQLATYFQNQNYDLYCFIPTEAAHFKKRGFDHIQALFTPFVDNTPLLIKKPTLQAQAQKNRQARFETPQFFEFSGQYKKMHHAKKILLLDDIYTTGRTFFHAKKCLREAGFQGSLVTFSLVRA